MAISLPAGRATYGLIACLVLSLFVVILLITLPIYHGRSSGDEPEVSTTTQISTESPETADTYGPDLSFDPHSQAYIDGVDERIQLPRYQFIPSQAEINLKKMEIRYNAVNNSYFRPFINGTTTGKDQERLPGWQNFLWRYYNIERKVEFDHNNVYLARIETYRDNKWNGLMEYRYNLQPARLKVKNLQIQVPYTVYRDGSVTVTLSAKEYSTSLTSTKTLTTISQANGWDDFIMRIELSGVRGDSYTKNAYQNAQLFREALGRPTSGVWEDPFQVVMEME